MTFSKQTDLVWLLGTSSAMVATLILVYLFPYPEHKAGQFWVYAAVLWRVMLYWGYGRTANGKVFLNLLGIGLVAGFVELLTDYFLVNWIDTGRLVYTNSNDVVFLASPAYMPFAWACVVVEFGYLILRLGKVTNSFVGTLIGALSAGVAIGFYELFAYKAGWWHYTPARAMIGEHCALYIPLGEFLMFLPFLWIVRRTERIADSHTRSIVAGALFGVTIFLAYASAYLILEKM